MNIVFMGSTEFSLKSLETLYKNHYNIIAVYTQSPKPAGRNQKIQKTVVHNFAESNNIPVYTPKTLKNSEQFDVFSKLKADLAVVAAYGLIIPQNILDLPKYGFINVHASLLPRWRGAAPIQSAILSGDKASGITIMKMNAGLDTGDIISAEPIEIYQKMNYGVLCGKMENLGAKMLIETLQNLESNLLNAKKQPEEGATYASKISKESCKINWNNSAEKILQQIMAFSPIPSAWSEIEGLRLKILDVDIAETEVTDIINKIRKSCLVCEKKSENESEIQSNTISQQTLEKIFARKIEIGELFEYEKNAYVACSDGALKLTLIQPAGKKTMSGADFLRGRSNLVGKIFS